MSSREGICWICTKREKCSFFRKYPNENVNVTDCGLFVMKEENRRVHDAIRHVFEKYLEDERNEI